jgi:transposase
MSDLYWLTDEQMAWLEPFFPKSHGKPRVDDRRVTLYNRWKRWGEKGVFTAMMDGLSARGKERKTARPS